MPYLLTILFILPLTSVQPSTPLSLAPETTGQTETVQPNTPHPTTHALNTFEEDDDEDDEPDCD